MSMEVSAVVNTSQTAKSSPCGRFLAILHTTRFEIRTTAFDLVRDIDLIPHKRARFVQIEWSPVSTKSLSSSRVLLANEDVIRVWDITDNQWSAKVDNGSGGMGKIAHVEFGKDEDEVLVFSSFGATMAVWSFLDGRMKEVKNPKFTKGGHGWNRPGADGVFAMLQRSVAQDVITIYDAETWSILNTASLTTVDAQGLKWSPDGRWLAVWETPSIGFQVHIYTADGILYRVYTGEAPDDTLAGLGVRSIEWSPTGEFLAIGGFEHIFGFHNTKTFAPTSYFAHSQTLEHSPTQIWQEQATAHARSYTSVTGLVNLPAASLAAADPKAKHGVSTLAFNADGTLLATKDDRMPTTVWIWDVRQVQPYAVLVQHTLIKHIAWHPSDPNLLLIQCSQDENFVYLWHATNGPRVLDLSANMLVGRVEVHWVHKYGQQKPAIMLASTTAFIVTYPEGSESLKLFFSDIGSKPNLPLDDSLHHDQTKDLVDGDIKTLIGLADDTFEYRKGVNVF